MSDSFVIRLAGVNIGIHTEYENLRRRMQRYFPAQADAAVNPNTAASPRFTVSITAEEREETLRLLRQANGPDFSCSDSYLEFLAVHSVIAEQLIDYNILMMHGSALSMDGDGYIFTAPSGTGKSTHARLWREAFGDRVTMINDDKPLLLCGENGIMVCGSPWNGKHILGENTERKLKAIVFLERAAENRIEPVDSDALFELLYLQTYHPKDPLRAMKAMELLSRICAQVAFYRLRCNMDQDAATVSYYGIQKAAVEHAK